MRAGPPVDLIRRGLAPYTLIMLRDFAGRRVTVMGLGHFGGGTGVTRWLAAQGADIVVTDLASADALAASLAEVDDLVKRGIVTLRLGRHNVSDFTGCDCVIANPAVPRPWENRFLRAAQAAGVPVTTEIRLLVERIDRTRVIGVTGTAGKSTTSAMIHHILRGAGLNAILGGNIGGSLLNALDDLAQAEWIVLELSSAMLYWLGEGVGSPEARGWSPHIGAITNVTPNHIDWHGSFEHYVSSKRNIDRYMTAGDRRLSGESSADSTAGEPGNPLRIPGRHNLRNARLAAQVAAVAAGIPTERSLALLAEFRGLPHRLQLVAEYDGRRFYNDSKSTTPEATRLAIESFADPRTVHLIVGGYDKGSDLTPIARSANRLAGLYTIGATGRSIAAAAPRPCFAEFCETLDAAIDRARGRMKAGDVLVLSPGCASWDQFANYEQRGERFTERVRASPIAPSRA
jgi:UDP-N-acetylmuramoylalanine--D-glutamate ligase